MLIDICVLVIEMVRTFGSSHWIASVFSVNENYQSPVEIENVEEDFGNMKR